MYEELSRLLAGELDASAEATLRARIAADPTLARAWADMSALPDLLGGLSFDAPPPALAARLAQMGDAASFGDDLHDAFGGLLGTSGATDFDPTRFDPTLFDAANFDSADETMDPDTEGLTDAFNGDGLTAPRHPVRARALARAPSSAQGREAFLDQLLTPVQRSPRTAPASSRAPRSTSARRVGVTAFVATLALAAGVVLGLNSPEAPHAPDAPAAVAISEGTTTVDGSVDLRAGDVRVRVDGRARVTLTPDDAAVARYDGAPAAEAPRVLVGEALAPTAQPDAIVADATPIERVREQIVASWSAVVGGSAPAPTRVPGAVAAAEPVRTAATTQASAGPGYRVTVQVERGGAQVAYDGLSVALAVGESRTFDAGGLKADRPQEGGHGTFDTPYGTSSEMHDQRDLDRAVRLAAALARTAAREGGSRPTGSSSTGADSERPRAGGPLHDEDRLLSVLEGVPGADLLDVDCTARPCVALIDYTGEDEAWADTLGNALASSFDAGVTLTESAVEVDGVVLGLVAVSVDDGKPAGIERSPRDDRNRAALRDVERELTE